MASCDWRVVFPIAALLSCLAGCGGDDPAAAQGGTAAGAGAGAPRELMVYAAASSRDVLAALEADLEKAHGVDLVFNFGSSSDLANQILAAAQADVYLSADEREMDRLEAAGLLAEGTRRSLLSNQLVVIEPADPRAPLPRPFTPTALTTPAVERLSLGNVETVPAGRYAKAWLERVGVWAAVEPRVLPGVDVRAALAAVESGAADAGIVYRTDAARSTRAKVVFEVPLAEGPKISYPIAAIAGRPGREVAEALLASLTQPAAAAVFDRFGFLVLEPATGR